MFALREPGLMHGPAPGAPYTSQRPLIAIGPVGMPVVESTPVCGKTTSRLSPHAATNDAPGPSVGLVAQRHAGPPSRSSLSLPGASWSWSSSFPPLPELAGVGGVTGTNGDTGASAM